MNTLIISKIITFIIIIANSALVAFGASNADTTPDQLTKYYQENQIEHFKALLPTAGKEELEHIFTTACDQQRTEFVTAILEYMPPDTDYDAMAGQMMAKGGQYHSLVYILDDTGTEKRQEIFDQSYYLGYVDIVKKLYDTTPDMNADELAERAYKDNDIVMFRVFKDDISTEKKADLTARAERDGRGDIFADIELTEEVITGYQIKASHRGQHVLSRFLKHFKNWLE